MLYLLSISIPLLVACIGESMSFHSKESSCNVGDLGSVPGLGRSHGGGQGNPLQYSCLENPHGQRSRVGYSPWGCKELDMTEQISTAQHACDSTKEPWDG